MVALGGIIGSELASNKAFATLPLSMTVVAVAATTIPATMLMKRIGRRKGSALASVSSAIAMIIAIVALYFASFPLFVLAAMLFGVNMAFTQQYRYAAAESVDAKYVPRAVSLVLVGSIGGALLGPELATRGQFWIESIPYGGTLAVLGVLYVAQSVLFLFMGAFKHEQAEDDDTAVRTTSELMRQPVFIVAVLGGTVGYGLMTLIMTATPLSMHVNEGFSLQETASVIRWHVLGMYVPSLFSGFLIEWFGVRRLMLAGALGLLGTSIIGLQGHEFLHYWWALLLLGIGWNFLYVGGTTMLTYTYSTAERFRAQAVNEFMVFFTSATASLLAGTVMHFFGWTTLMLVPIPILLVIGVALVVVRRDPLLNREAVADAR